jgi:hypothetical protein
VKTFKQFIEEDNFIKNALIQETPSRVGELNLDSVIPDFNSFSSNIKNTKNILFSKKLIKIGTIDNLNIYTNINENLIFYIIGEIKTPFTVGYIRGNYTNNEFNEEFIWQWDTHKGLIRKFYLNFLLDRYTIIVSDSLHSDMGENFWIKLCEEALNRNIKVYIRNIKENKEISIKNIKHIKSSFGDDERYENIKIVLKK